MVIDLRCDAASICLYCLGAIAGYARDASEIGDDDGGDILNIINSRSDDEGRDGWRGAARIINTAIPACCLTLSCKCVSTFSPHFVFLHGIEIEARMQ